MHQLQVVEQTAPETARIPVQVHAPDPISRAGAISQLCQHPDIDLVTQAPGKALSVSVVITETVDENVLLTLRRLERTGSVRTVLVVQQVREADLLKILGCGVGAILWRHQASAQRMLQSVLAAARGDGDLPADLLGRLLSEVSRMHHSTSGENLSLATRLSSRETDILRLVAEGLHTIEIARELCYSERSVKNVLHGLTSRLGLRNRAHAVAHAIREGYI